MKSILITVLSVLVINTNAAFSKEGGITREAYYQVLSERCQNSVPTSLKQLEGNSKYSKTVVGIVNLYVNSACGIINSAAKTLNSNLEIPNVQSLSKACDEAQKNFNLAEAQVQVNGTDFSQLEKSTIVGNKNWSIKPFNEVCASGYFFIDNFDITLKGKLLYQKQTE